MEVVFSLLTERQLKYGVHTSVNELIDCIEAFVDAHNEDPKPFRWTRPAEQILESLARYCGRVLDRHGQNSESSVPDPDAESINIDPTSGSTH